MHADKHESFIQVDTNLMGIFGQVCPQYQKNMFAISFAISQERCKDEVDFLLAYKHQSFQQVDGINWKVKHLHALWGPSHVHCCLFCVKAAEHFE